MSFLHKVKRIVLDEFETKTKIFQVVPPNPERRWNYWPEAGDINALLFLMDGNLAIAPANDFIQIWNPQEGKLIYKLETKCWTILAFVQMPNSYLVAGDVYGRIEVWDLERRKPVKYLVGHKSSVCSLKVLANGHLASYSQDDSIIIWDLYQENSFVCKISGHGNMLAYPPMSLLSNGFLVTSTQKPDRIRIWNPNDGQMVKELTISSPGFKHFYVLPDDDIALVTADGLVRILNLIEETTLRTLIKPVGAVAAMAHIQNSRSVLVILKNPNMPLLDASESSNPHKLNVIESFDFSADKKVFATVGSFGRIVLWFISS